MYSTTYIVDIRTETRTVDIVYSTNTSASNYLHQIQFDKIENPAVQPPIMRTIIFMAQSSFALGSDLQRWAFFVAASFLPRPGGQKSVSSGQHLHLEMIVCKILHSVMSKPWTL